MGHPMSAQRKAEYPPFEESMPSRHGNGKKRMPTEQKASNNEKTPDHGEIKAAQRKFWDAMVRQYGAPSTKDVAGFLADLFFDLEPCSVAELELLTARIRQTYAWRTNWPANALFIKTLSEVRQEIENQNKVFLPSGCQQWLAWRKYYAAPQRAAQRDIQVFLKVCERVRAWGFPSEWPPGFGPKRQKDAKIPGGAASKRGERHG